GNSAAYGYGGGSYYGTLNNCTLSGNSAAYGYGGGSYYGTLNNCIIFYNLAPSGPNFSSGTLNYCCTTPAPGGTGNITNEPGLISMEHIAADSACIGKASGAYSSGLDIDGEAWRVQPSIGCDEPYPASATGAVSVAIDAVYTNFAAGFEASFTALIDGGVTSNAWDFGDGGGARNRLYASHTWATTGTYAVVLLAWNADHPSGAACTTTVSVVERPTYYVNVLNPSPVYPYNSWETAATNIQDAITAAGIPGPRLVMVTNGDYNAGGALVSGVDTTNRIALTDAVTLTSVNGPAVTTIKGKGPVGSAAMRCAYVGSNCVLAGFTLTNGATTRHGGGVYCENGGLVSNCTLSGNSAANYGGGSYNGTLNNCTLSGNSAISGGGSYRGTLNNCTLAGNSAISYGGGSSDGTLNNCTLSGNSASSGGGGSYNSTLNNCTLSGNSSANSGGGGSYAATLNNCIVYYNTAPTDPNYSYGTLRYCCTSPSPVGGTGNITNDPGLVSVGHIAVDSPCVGKGSTNYISGMDIDGEAWRTQPAIGCDEPYSSSVTGPVSVAISTVFTEFAVGYDATFTALIGGAVASSAWDFGDGMGARNRLYASHAWSATGTYAVVLTAWNADHPSGVVCTTMVSVVEQPIYYVNLSNPSPAYPYTSWATAATNIQDAVTAEGFPGPRLVMVTNGVYETGGAVASGSMINRIALTNAVSVRSVNGPDVTIIRGQGPAGPGAMRCAYVGTNCVLAGFTLTGGATLTNSSYNSERNGGGVYCENGCLVSKCILSSNAAANRGGGAYQGDLKNCTLLDNSANSGGGAYGSRLNNCRLSGNSAANCGGGSYYGALNNCTLSGNSAATNGGGAYYGALNNCTLSGNSAGTNGGGSCYSDLSNCIVYYNTAPVGPNSYGAAALRYCCTTPGPGGTGTITNDPGLVSIAHIAANSPCIGKGSTNYASGLDIDGETWRAAPSIGCDEPYPTSRTGPVSVAISAPFATVAIGYNASFAGLIDGAVTSNAWDFGDGSGARNQLYASHTWAATGTYAVVLTAWNADHPSGVVCTTMVSIVDLVYYVNAANPAPVYPYRSWPTAATNIQDAISAAGIPGRRLVMVTNGVYETGCAVVSGAGAITNRIALTNAVTVCSVNGPDVTIIRGKGPAGPGAMRCAYVASNCVLSGFTLTGGATALVRDFSGFGGGVFCEDGALVSECWIMGNSAGGIGGGAYRGILNNCRLEGNFADSGGGSWGSALNNCTLSGNSAAANGGGSYSGILKNCTLSGNSAAAYGGGSYGSALNNCIVYYNKAPDSPNFAYGTLQYSCTTPDPGGTGNTTDEPGLVSGSHIAADSSCVGKGNTNYASGVDIDGEPWRNPPAIGADEPSTTLATGDVSAAIKMGYSAATPGFEVPLTALIEGRVTGSAWDFGDGSVVTNRPYVSHTWAATGSYAVVLTAWNADHPTGVSCTTIFSVVEQPVRYVSMSNPTPAYPYTTWATAATNIQQAISADATGGRLVLVTNGTYAVGGTVVYGALTNRVALVNGVTVRSVNGPEATVIKGFGPWYQSAAVRCAYVGKDCVLAGFTLTNGATFGSGSDIDKRGGGVWCDIGAMVSNCWFIGNAARYGGGSYLGKLNHCRFMNNYGGSDGGGAYGGTLNNCTLTGNFGFDGGGAAIGTLNNCSIIRNAAWYGGGTYYANLNNCTIVGNCATNYSDSSGGGSYGGTLNSCIIYYNTAAYSHANYRYAWPDVPQHCCTMPAPYNGVGHITNEPAFRNAASGDYRLAPNSPCIDAGINQDWMFEATDLAGNPRILNGTADMGAYETPLTLNLRALLQGPYDTNTHAMAAGDPANIPLTSPYATDPRVVASIPSNVVDWMLVELVGTNGRTVVSKSALMDTLGQLIASDGSTGITAEVSAGYYSVVLKHRNPLAAMSSAPVAF
ncbi:MAG: PKD domain-containing protein, partial [Verrucomicrobiae bacterium]|nr:PKD domain-containing protein [Verrucomicrobiae bacterium]